MDLHLVGGFLGSGKTTAIASAAKQLMAQGKRVGVVTNDQGKYLVDTLFMQFTDIPTVQVSGGCFCCHYDDLTARLRQLEQDAHPHVIFAESVGSCADIVATVVNPLLELGQGDVPPTSLSIFVDARLLHRRLHYQPMPFSENVVYIFDKQIEEAGLLVINKIDLLDTSQADEIQDLASTRFPGKRIHRQNSLDAEQISTWIDLISSDPLRLGTAPLAIDYRQYADGEAALAWLDEEILWTVPPNQGRNVVQTFMDHLRRTLQQRRCPVGHVKFIVRGQSLNGQQSIKLSCPSLAEADWQHALPDFEEELLSLVVNARVETSAEMLREIVQQTLAQTKAETGASYHEQQVDYFHPGAPHPTHRITRK